MSEKEIRKNLLDQKSIQDNNKSTSFFSLFRYADKMDKGLMLVGSIAAIGAGVASPLFMIFFATVSELFIPGNEEIAEYEGRMLFVKLLVVGIMTWICHALGMWAWNKSGARQAIRLKKLYYEALLCQEVAWYDKQDTTKITTQISQNTTCIETAIGQKISYTITALVTSMFGFVYSFAICWQMSLYLTIFLPFMLTAGFLLMRTMVLKAKTGKLSYENAAGVAENAFNSIKTIKMCVSQKFQIRKFVQQLVVSQPKVFRYTLYSSLSSGFMNLIMLGLYSFGFFIGKEMMIMNPGQYKASEIISTFFCFMVAGQSIGQISPIFKSIADAKVAATKIYELVNKKHNSIQNSQGQQIIKIKQIKIKEVGFSYEGNLGRIKTLQRINAELKPKTMTALVGESGSGKSTITQLLLRYYDPQKGSITINDRDLKEYNIYSYRKRVGYVGQQPILFSMSIKENIQLSNPNITGDELVKVLKLANAWEFVQKLPEGVQTYVGNRGTQLSGGQKQRIAIARALAKNPDLLILDQATSALDSQNEYKLQSTLCNIASESEITILVIAHRLSTIRNANNILVIHQGQIVESGNHEQLKLNKNGYYYRIIQNQLFQSSSLPTIVSRSKNEEKDGQNMTSDISGKPENISMQNKQIQQQKAPNIYIKLLKQSKSLWKFLIIGSMLALINGLVYPFFNVSFSNVMGLMSEPEQNQSQINKYCLYFLLIAIGGALSNFSHNLLFGLYGERLVFSLRVKIFKKLIKFPVPYFDKKQNTPGAISSKLSQDSYQLHNVVTGLMSVLFLNFSTIVLTLVFSFYFSWKLTLIVLLFSPLLAAKGVIAANVLKRMSQKSDEIQRNVGSLISDSICNIRTVKSFGGYEQFTRMVGQKLDKVENILSDKALKIGILQGFSRSSATLVYAIVFWVASAIFAHHQFNEPRDALVSIFCIVFASTIVGQNSQLMPDIAKAEKASHNIFQILQTKDEFQIAKCVQNKNLKDNKIKGTIQFCNVQFSYPQRNQKILQNFNLKIKESEKIAIVGESGSGKSTLIQILGRLYPIQKGKVLMDGIPIEHYNLRKYRRQLGIVSQQPSLFKGTIRQNALYKFVDNNKYEKRLIKYCKIGCVDKFVEDEELKYDKQIGERGALVSGGQKQRIAIVRCLIQKPRIILMDEPTSALDAQTEAELFQNMQYELKGKHVYIRPIDYQPRSMRTKQLQ